MGTAAYPVAVDTRNRAPVFEDQDTETDGVQNETATREVEENTKALAGGGQHVTTMPTTTPTTDDDRRQRGQCG